MIKQMKRKKSFVNQKYCVACGACEEICPISAIHIEKGIYSKVNFDKCVGCRKCEKVCPASAIEIKEVIING